MKSPQPFNPIYNPKVLDITDIKKKSKEDLKKDIIEGIKDTQRVIIQQLPNELLMRVDQYKLLQDDPEMKHAFTSDNHLYWTPDAVMEVRVLNMTIQGNDLDKNIEETQKILIEVDDD